MRATVMRDGALVVDDLPDPTPKTGQLLVRTLACGICGSDLHALEHGDDMVAMSNEGGGMTPGEGMPAAEVMDLTRDVVMGHEFCAEVVGVGDNVGNCSEGDVVVSVPITLDPEGLHPIGYSNEYPGGYGELMVLSDLLALKVPNGLEPRRAALTEPMAVGVHAVNKSGIGARDAAVVLGCGPIGLAVIAALRLLGVEMIVAADFSPARRALATTMGAHEVVDPSSTPAMERWREVDGRRSVVIYEAVGVPGMIESAMREAPRGARVLVVGVCMQADTIRPMHGIAKELSIQFVLGYDPVEFGETLRRIAEGEIDVDPLITGSVDIDGVAGAFEALRDPEAHAKILVQPAP